MAYSPIMKEVYIWRGGYGHGGDLPDFGSGRNTVVSYCDLLTELEKWFTSLDGRCPQE